MEKIMTSGMEIRTTSDQSAGTSFRPTWVLPEQPFSRVVSARAILRNIERSYEAMDSELVGFPTLQDDLKRDLLYFISVADGNEDAFGHSQSVAAYALLLARETGIQDPRWLADLERGALLHDIGKIAIPDSILRKPGALTPLEREIVQEHPLVGYEVIRGFDFLKDAAEVVLRHHERFDGRGYPYGLAGDDIPLGARIFSIADTIDAITSDRPYRKGRGFEDAFREVKRSSGTQFDPLLVEVMSLIPKERWFQARLSTLARLSFPTIH
jgi:putative nucleotidyltransferase with HDIG domain